MSEVMTKVVAINRAISEEQYRSNHPFYNRFKELIGQLPCAHSGILQPGYSLHGGTNNKNDLCEKTRKKRHLRKLTVKNEIYHWMPNQNRDNAIAGVCATCPVLAPVIATLFAELPTTQT